MQKELTSVVASDGRYHVDCKRNFCLRIATVEQELGDSSFLEVVRAIKADKVGFGIM